jgi:hypothetical protein
LCDPCKTYLTIWNDANREKIREYRKKWGQQPEGKQSQQQAQKRYREQHPERRRETEYNNYWNHRERHLTNAKASGARGRAKLRALIFEHYGRQCACCGENIEQFLTVDHIDGKGAEHRRSIGGHATGTTFYRWLKKQSYPEGFQILCWNCNLAKSQYGSCPHESPRVTAVS